MKISRLKLPIRVTRSNFMDVNIDILRSRFSFFDFCSSVLLAAIAYMIIIFIPLQVLFIFYYFWFGETFQLFVSLYYMGFVFFLFLLASFTYMRALTYSRYLEARNV